jgi:ketosteroid isomerase-like protein
MKGNYQQFFRSLSIILVLLPFSSNSFGQNHENDKNAIKQLYYDMGDALMEKDWDRWQSYWVEDNTLNVVHPGNQDWASGWEEVMIRYKPLFGPDVNMKAEVTAEPFKIYVAPGGEFAWAIYDQKVKMGEHQMQSWGVMVLKKTNGNWQVNLAFDADLPPTIEK